MTEYTDAEIDEIINTKTLVWIKDHCEPHTKERIKKRWMEKLLE